MTPRLSSLALLFIAVFAGAAVAIAPVDARDNELRRDTQTYPLPDGRVLGYAEYGPADGKPIFYFHGNPGSRLDVWMVDPAMFDTLGVRIVAVDRPGFGLSTIDDDRSFRDWADDVAALADGLGIERFGIIGLSTGGPSALAVAHYLPERVVGVAALVSVVPIYAIPNAVQEMASSRTYFGLAEISPLLVRPLLALMRTGLAEPENFLKQASAQMPRVDQDMLRQARPRDAFVRSMQEAFAQSTAGMAFDATLAARAWSFKVEELTVPVSVWYGGADRNTPPSFGRYLARKIPGAVPFYFRDEGHFSLGVKQFGPATAWVAKSFDAQAVSQNRKL